MKHGHVSTGNISQTSPNYALVASGTTAQRPAVGKTGMLRFNTELGYFECFVSGVWSPVNFTFMRERAPTLADDNTQGYALGSVWIWGSRVYMSTSVATGAAMWIELSPYPTHPGLTTGRYYGSSADGNTLTTTQYGANVIYAIPIFLSTGLNFNRVGLEVTSRGLFGANNGRMALYNNDASTGLPGTLAADLGQFGVTTTGAKEIAVNVNVSGTQFFWLVCMFDGTVTTRSTTSSTGSFILGRATTSGTGINCVTASFTFGAFPSTFPTAEGATSNPPFMWFRKV